jgi:hypothetical protein
MRAGFRKNLALRADCDFPGLSSMAIGQAAASTPTCRMPPPAACGRAGFCLASAAGPARMNRPGARRFLKGEHHGVSPARDFAHRHSSAATG